MTRTVEFSARARRDFAQIWSYSVEMWGISRTQEYIDAIEAALHLVDAQPATARDASHIRPGLLRYSVGSHVIFLRILPSQIRVVRILHNRMDLARHL